MLAIIDKRSPKSSIENLGNHARDVLLFESKDISYNSISGHPDIFIYKSENDVVIAPNAPDILPHFLEQYNIEYRIGHTFIDETFKNSVAYNCIATKDKLFHKFGMTEKKILEHCSEKQFINLPQAYTRCSMINLYDDTFITSDYGILNVLHKHNFNSFYFNPEEIKIIDHTYGFFGGTCGTYKNCIFFNGNILKHKDGSSAKTFIEKSEFKIISLNNDFLYDGGGIFLI